jgi:hypothetical protein
MRYYRATLCSMYAADARRADGTDRLYFRLIRARSRASARYRHQESDQSQMPRQTLPRPATRTTITTRRSSSIA